MNRIAEMMQTHPHTPQVDISALAACVEECLHCGQACASCADACLGEENVSSQVSCIRSCQDCADVCLLTGKLLSRLTEANWPLLRAQVDACRTACGICAQECEAHAGHMEHCRICAEVCRSCESACNDLLTAIPS